MSSQLDDLRNGGYKAPAASVNKLAELMAAAVQEARNQPLQPSQAPAPVEKPAAAPVSQAQPKEDPLAPLPISDGLRAQAAKNSQIADLVAAREAENDKRAELRAQRDAQAKPMETPAAAAPVAPEPAKESPTKTMGSIEPVQAASAPLKATVAEVKPVSMPAMPELKPALAEAKPLGAPEMVRANYAVSLGEKMTAQAAKANAAAPAPTQEPNSRANGWKYQPPADNAPATQEPNSRANGWKHQPSADNAPATPTPAVQEGTSVADQFADRNARNDAARAPGGDGMIARGGFMKTADPAPDFPPAAPLPEVAAAQPNMVSTTAQVAAPAELPAVATVSSAPLADVPAAPAPAAPSEPTTAAPPAPEPAAAAPTAPAALQPEALEFIRLVGELTAEHQARAMPEEGRPLFTMDREDYNKLNEQLRSMTPEDAKAAIAAAQQYIEANGMPAKFDAPEPIAPMVNTLAPVEMPAIATPTATLDAAPAPRAPEPVAAPAQPEPVAETRVQIYSKSDIPTLDTKETIVLQAALEQAGFDLGKKAVDGICGPKTKAALAAMCTELQIDPKKIDINGPLNEETMKLVQGIQAKAQERQQQMVRATDGVDKPEPQVVSGDPSKIPDCRTKDQKAAAAGCGRG